MRILCAVQPVDFRKGIDGLCAVCRQVLKENPFSGAVFVFCNRLRTSLKVLVYDGQGFWLCQKRLSSGKFSSWPGKQTQETVREYLVHEVQLLLWNGNPAQAHACRLWKPLLPVGAQKAAM